MKLCSLISIFVSTVFLCNFALANNVNNNTETSTFTFAKFANDRALNRCQGRSLQLTSDIKGCRLMSRIHRTGGKTHGRTLSAKLVRSINGRKCSYTFSLGSESMSYDLRQRITIGAPRFSNSCILR